MKRTASTRTPRPYVLSTLAHPVRRKFEGHSSFVAERMQSIREHKVMLQRIRFARRKSDILFLGTEKQANELPQEVVTSTFDTGRVGI